MLCGGATNRDCALSLLAVEPDQGVDPIVAQIASAKTSIEYTPFTLDDPEILQALRNAHLRGVRVRVLLEPHPEQDGGVGSIGAEALRSRGIDVLDTNPAFALTHAKYMVIDNARALILTFNSTVANFETRRDFGIIDSDLNDVQRVQNLFEADWDRKPFGTIPAGFAVSPENSNQALTGLIGSARSRIDIYAEKLLASPVLDAILAAANRGVHVRILSAPLDPKDRTLESLLQAERSGALEIRIPRRPRVHAKVMIVDGASVFLGSENVQDAPRAGRRELGITFQSPDLETAIAAVFEKDWAAPGETFP